MDQSQLRPGHRVHRQQRRVRKALVQILHDNAGLVQHQVPVRQGRQIAVGIEVQQVFGQFARLDEAGVPAVLAPGRHDGLAHNGALFRRLGFRSR